MFAQHAIACVLCELLCLELFNVFFQHENRFRYKFFRYCSIFKVLCASALAADGLIILPQKRFFVKLFFSRLLNVLNLDRFMFLGADRNFSASIGSFQRFRAETSEVILLSQRLALKYNTTPRQSCQHFSASFLRKI